MRVWRFDEFDGLKGLHLHEEPIPIPQRGEVLLQVQAVSLNYRDIAMPLGLYPARAEPGQVPTSDAAAEVVAVGEGVRLFRTGDRVISSFHRRWFGGPPSAGWQVDAYGALEDGWLAEYKVASEESVVRLPDSISYERGATLPCAATTAWTALGGSNVMQPGQTILTLGTGGVSLFAVQLGKALGARVIATTSSASKAERLRDLGADDVINYVEVKNWGERAKELTQGRGVDRVVENAGANTIEQSLRAVATWGVVALVGFVGGKGSGVEFSLLFGSGATIQRISVGSRTDLQDVVRVISTLKLEPVIDQVFAFDQAPAAFERLQSGQHIGKIVIALGNPVL